MFFYNLFIRLLISAIKIASVFNYKLKRGLAGRRQSCDIVDMEEQLKKREAESLARLLNDQFQCPL